MPKPVYYIHKPLHKSDEEIEKKLKLFQNAGFKVVIITDGEDSDIVSCFKKMIKTYFHS